MLYYIFILHQTTTQDTLKRLRFGCIISSFYIKPQLVAFPTVALWCCIISSFYIKPQPRDTLPFFALSCIISSFYIKPQLTTISSPELSCCIISSFYIKPQLHPPNILSLSVVLYLHSTSNHNLLCIYSLVPAVVLYLHSTSNHNYCLYWLLI